MKRTPIALIVSLLLAGCGRGPSPPSLKSPDGMLTLSTSVNQTKADRTQYLCVIIDIVDSTGKTLHHEVTPASDVHRWSIQWVTNDELLLKSSDVGNYHVLRQTDGTWKGQLGPN
jgi:hypothetical protein